MKIYAVIVRCEDNYYPDYQIVDDRVYLKEEDARKRLDEMVKDIPYTCWPDQIEIYDFEVRE